METNPLTNKTDEEVLLSMIAAGAKAINEIRRAKQSILQDLDKAETRIGFDLFAANELLNRIKIKEINHGNN